MEENTPDYLQAKDNDTKELGPIVTLVKGDDCYNIDYQTGEKARLYIMNKHVFRYHMSADGTFPEYPEPNNPTDKAKIIYKTMAEYGNKAFGESILVDNGDSYSINTDNIQIVFDKATSVLSVTDKRTKDVVLKELSPISYSKSKSIQTLKQGEKEYFYGGGMQNGRFSHKGKLIDIVNTNKWVDGYVSSPCPFYWSTKGYGILRNTWKSGYYDFGVTSLKYIRTVHNTGQFDAFFFINPFPIKLLGDYYELTGQPIFFPKFAFYEAHLNTFNRDYWVKVDANTPRAILYEDGFYYKRFKPEEAHENGILESLNGEKNNYQFSARAMIDRYKKHDMPLGWFIPNDGYGSGYGQTDSLEGDIQNLKVFADYARANGVQVGLWTESNLEPADPDHPKKGERDLKKEITEAGVVALKADVAWIGEGYSFGLSAIEHVADIFIEETKERVRPMALMVDGWAGTQRCSSIWSGDQYGGQWEYIRFHIPTYIGTGLSGQPNFGSDMDGIYGGQHRKVNIRDFQWKTFTPLQLNMDGWGNTQKTPFSFDEEAAKIKRAYLKLKSMMIPYNYTLGHEATYGLPMVRAMFLEFPDETLGYTTDSQYQYMWGPNVLVAPVYNDKEDGDGNSIRDGIYLPDASQKWIDFFTGESYKGGQVINVNVPLWKIPIFIRDGAIIPLANPNNNPGEIKQSERRVLVYPNEESNFTIYEDDGTSLDYLKGVFMKTNVHAKSNKTDTLLTIDKSEGTYNGVVTERNTILYVKTSEVEKVKIAIDDRNVEVIQCDTKEEFDKADNAFFYDKDFYINPHLEGTSQAFLLIKIMKVDVTKSTLHVKISGKSANVCNVY